MVFKCTNVYKAFIFFEKIAEIKILFLLFEKAINLEDND